MIPVLASLAMYTETLYPEFAQQMQIKEVLHQEKSAWQDLIIFENDRFGRVLALDGVIQTTYLDNQIYAEMLVHVPFLAHGNVKKVLIIGGGDGSVLKQALRYPQLEKAVVVDIDDSVVEMTKKWMPEVCSSAFEDPRASVIINDATIYIKETDEKFDVIICDSTDPEGPGAVLFTKDFYRDCKNHLKHGGILVNQNGVPFLQKDELSMTMENRSLYFSDVGFYVVAMPTYIGGFMALGWATDNKDLQNISLEMLKERFSSLEGDFMYYNPEIHKASFALPSFMKIEG